MEETRLNPKLGDSAFGAFFSIVFFVFNLSVTFDVNGLPHFAFRASVCYLLTKRVFSFSKGLNCVALL